MNGENYLNELYGLLQGKATRKAAIEESAQQLKQLYDAYIKVGFTDHQAFELVAIMVDNSTK